MQRIYLLVRMTLAAVIALLLAPTLTLAQGTTHLTITGTEFAFSPMHATVPQGQAVQVTFTNAGKYPHNMTFEMESTKVEYTVFASPLMAGESRTGSYTFPMAGEWKMYCPVDSHEAKGMVGIITVEAAAAPGMPSTGNPTFLGLLLIAVGLLGLTSGLALRTRSRAGRPL